MALSGAALAHDGPGDRDDHGDHGKRNGDHHGKKRGHHGDGTTRTFTVTTTDNGSCGTPWATDVVKRTFFVKKNSDGSYTLTRFDRGQFTTLAGKSPGACDTTGSHGQTVLAGVQGRLFGYIRGTVTGGTFDNNATCTGPECGFTDVFLKTFFGPTAQFSCFTDSSDCTFDFRYRARDQGLLFNRWQDKGSGAGTMLNEEFNGDIANA